MIEIPENVNAFSEQCADMVAAYHRHKFAYDLPPDLVICGSPIEQLFYLLNERQIQQRSTVISTNLSMEELRKRYPYYAKTPGPSFFAAGKHRSDFK